MSLSLKGKEMHSYHNGQNKNHNTQKNGGTRQIPLPPAGIFKHLNSEDPLGLIGKTITETPYTIVGYIGGGGMGHIYLVEDRSRDTPKLCAVKFIHPHLTVSSETLARFLKEVEITREINHPNIVRIIGGARMFKDYYFFAMEYLNGMDLYELITIGGSLKHEFFLRVFVQVCNALEAAHTPTNERLGVIHRDIKPENIFICSDGTIKVLDFGIAKLLLPQDIRDAGGHLTQQGVVIGTIDFMAPEQISLLSCDGRTDIYSTGAVMYFALTKNCPFSKGDGSDEITVIGTRHIQDKPVPPREIDSSIPKPLEDITLRALEKKQKDRFQSAQELREALLAYAATVGIDYTALTTPISENGAQPLELELLTKCHQQQVVPKHFDLPGRISRTAYLISVGIFTLGVGFASTLLTLNRQEESKVNEHEVMIKQHHIPVPIASTTDVLKPEESVAQDAFKSATNESYTLRITTKPTGASVNIVEQNQDGFKGPRHLDDTKPGIPFTIELTGTQELVITKPGYYNAYIIADHTNSEFNLTLTKKK